MRLAGDKDGLFHRPAIIASSFSAPATGAGSQMNFQATNILASADPENLLLCTLSTVHHDMSNARRQNRIDSQAHAGGLHID